MTLRFMDGCQAGDALTKYSNVVNSPVRSTSTPPVVGGAYYTMSGTTLEVVFGSTASEVFGHIRFRHQTSASTTFQLSLWGDSGATQHLTFVVNANVVKVYRGTSSGTLLATGATTITAAWHVFEFRATISDSTGVVQVWLEGGSSTEINLSSTDTKNGGTNSSIDKVRIVEAGSNWDFSDFILSDASGSYNNSRMGEVTVRTLTPNGDGNSSQLLGSDGNSTNNYLLVDEVPFGDSDYVGSPTSGQGDTYTMTDLTGTPTVRAVQVTARMGKSDAGVVQGKNRIRSGGTNYASAAKTPVGTGFGAVTELYETDPATSSPWTYTNVNALEVGAEVA